MGRREPGPSLAEDCRPPLAGQLLHGLGLDINLIPQARSVNRGKGSQWASIERELAKRPGSAVAIRLVYSDDSQRPASFEFGYGSDSGFRVGHIDNPEFSPIGIG